LVKFVQQIGQQQGWEIPQHLLAPPPPPLPLHRDSTPVSEYGCFTFYAHT
jgi:hypothetical protein